ncbi:MAG: hypothetical protein ACLP8S_32120 [Solirubrobacteraceae bacterium]
MGERDIADQQHRRTGGQSGGAEGRRHRPVNPVGAAITRARANLAYGEELLDVPDRHRGRDEQRRFRRQPLAEPGSDERFRDRVAEDLSDRSGDGGRWRWLRRAVATESGVALASAFLKSKQDKQLQKEVVRGVFGLVKKNL